MNTFVIFKHQDGTERRIDVSGIPPGDRSQHARNVLNVQILSEPGDGGHSHLWKEIGTVDRPDPIERAIFKAARETR